MSLGSGVMPQQFSWSLGAPNAPCARETCRHQHERAKVVNGRVEYSPCKVLMITKEDDFGKRHKIHCDCSVRM